MTREEAIQFLDNMKHEEAGRAIGEDGFYADLMGYHVQALNMAIKVLEQEPCDDAISREKVIDITWEEPSYIDALNVLTEVRDKIRALPSVTPAEKVGRWIPVSEHLPNDRRPVLVTAYWHETYQVMMASYFGDGLWWCVPFNNCGKHEQKLNPKAWLPLPEPYKEG